MQPEEETVILVLSQQNASVHKRPLQQLSFPQRQARVTGRQKGKGRPSVRRYKFVKGSSES